MPFLEIEAPTLTVDQPSDGASFENGAIPVAGTATNAATVVVSATYVGPSGPAPGGGKATPAPPPAPPSVTATVGDDGTYSTPYELTAGKWLITVTASGPEGKTAALTRAVTVGYKGVNLVVTAKGGRAWIKVWVDGKLDPGVGAAGQVHLERQVPQVHRQGVGRGPDRLVGRDAVHAERHATRCTRSAPACPRPGCSPRPRRPKRPSGARPWPTTRSPSWPTSPSGSGRCCSARGLRVATVESCTGGLVGHLITEVPGSSAYFVGGFVTYSDALKREAVGVPDDVLAAHGAVSAQVAMAMATGGRERTGADLAVVGDRDRRAGWRIAVQAGGPDVRRGGRRGRGGRPALRLER